MIKSSIACAALMVCSPPGWAELTVQDLDAQPFGTDISELFELGQGDLFLRMRGLREVKEAKVLSEALVPWSAVYLLAPSGKIKQRVELPRARYQWVVPYLNGFVVLRSSPETCTPRCGPATEEPSEIVAYERPTDTRPRVLYQRQPDFHTMLLVGAPDGQDLYVMEVGTQANRLTRIDSHGKVVWQQSSDWIESSSFVATDDGIALVQYVSPQDAAMVLKALDRDGRTRWETRLPRAFRYSEPVLFSPAGFITVPKHSEERQERLVNFDARTGRLISDFVAQPFAYAVGTKDGLLLTGWMLGQRYIGMLGADGEFSWLRRYVPDQHVNDIQRAVMTRAGKLVLLSQERAPTTIPIPSIVITDSTAASLGETRGRCLDADWAQSEELASQLHNHSLFVQALTAEELFRKDQSCTDREAQVVAFMKDLASVLPPAAQATDPRLTIVVRLTAAGEPLRLESYAASRSGFRGAGVRLVFAVPYDQATEFWKTVSTRVLPHLERMRALEEQFERLTGFDYFVSAGSDPSYADLEKAARKVNQRISTIAPETLAEIRRTGPIGHVGIVLGPDGFGASTGVMYSVEVADQTFLSIVEENRRAAEQGHILIVD